MIHLFSCGQLLASPSQVTLTLAIGQIALLLSTSSQLVWGEERGLIKRLEIETTAQFTGSHLYSGLGGERHYENKVSPLDLESNALTIRPPYFPLFCSTLR